MKNFPFIILLNLFLLFSSLNTSLATDSTTIEYIKKQLLTDFSNRKNFIDDFYQIESFYRISNPIAGINFFTELLGSDKFPKNDTVLTYLYASLGSLYSHLDRAEQSSKLYYLSTYYAKRIKEMGVVAWNMISIGNIYYNFGNVQSAREKYDIAIQIADSMLKSNKLKSQDLIDAYNHIITVSTENIGLCFQTLGNFDSAYFYINKLSKKRLENPSKINAQYHYLALSDLFISFPKPDSTIKYALLSLNVDTSLIYSYSDKRLSENYKLKAYVHLTMAYYLKKQIPLMKEYETIFKHIVKTINNNPLPTLGYLLMLIEFYMNQKDFNKAKETILFALKIKSDIKDLFIYKTKLNQYLAEIYDRQGNYKEASKIKAILLQKIDSTIYQFRTQGIALAEIDLNLQNQIDTIKELEETSKTQKAKLEAQKTINLLYTLIVFGLIILIFITVLAYRNNRKHLSTISKQNEELRNLNMLLNKNIIEKDNINSELMKSQNELMILNDDLEKINQTQNTLFSIIAHDMKNAIGGIRSLNQILVEDYYLMPDKDRKEYIDLMNNSSIEMYRLLENLLLWSNTQKGQIKLSREPNRPEYFIDRNFQLYKQAIDEKKITTKKDLPPDFQFNFDANMFDTIIRNLLNNAIKFSNDGGEITISMAIEGNFAHFQVKDTGVGMPPEKAANIFKFDKHKSTRGTRGEKGTGLGLMICYDFVKMHGGEIWFESEVGRGTIAHFTMEM